MKSFQSENLIVNSTKTFILKSKSIHGDLYDYSKVIYKKNRIDVVIICKKHGEFTQKPCKHLMGRGCRKCSGSEKLTNKEFIKRANEVHNNKYSYEKVNYQRRHEKVLITCKEHGDFFQEAGSHLLGSGCSECSRISRSSKRRLSLNEVLERFRTKHGNFYDYSKIDFKNIGEKVTIICPKHGEFRQTPAQHFVSVGCVPCVDRSWTRNEREKKNVTRNDFLKRAFEIHGNFYNYDFVKFQTFEDEVLILCPIHNSFKQKIKNHLSGSGCKKCGNTRISQSRTLTFDDFVRRAQLIHDKKYKYYEKNWVNGSTKIEIICSKHGGFYQTPNSHLRGQGCNECGKIKRWEKRNRNSTKDIVKFFQSIHGDQYDYSRFKYQDHHFKSIIICPIHGEFLQSASNHRAGKGCPDCKNLKIGDALRKDVKDVIKDFKLVHGDKYDYKHVLKEYINSDTPVTIICPKHGSFLQAPYNHLSGKNCPKCKESHGEEKIRRYLEKNNIEFIYQWKDHDCINIKPLKFDFYIPNYKLLIEFDGEQHFDPKARWWSKNEEENLIAFEKAKSRDEMKNKWSKENGFNLIRINYQENIEVKLSTFFDANNNF